MPYWGAVTHDNRSRTSHTFPIILKLARTEFRGAGLEGIGIEQEPDRVKLSRRVIERLGLSDRIRIIKGNHLMLPIEAPVDLIMVAAQAEPKDTIFNHLATIMPAGTKISYRIYEKDSVSCWIRFLATNYQRISTST